MSDQRPLQTAIKTNPLIDPDPAQTGYNVHCVLEFLSDVQPQTNDREVENGRAWVLSVCASALRWHHDNGREDQS